MTTSRRYHTSQLVAHWTVVFLVLFQLAFNDEMQRGFHLGVELGALPQVGGIYTHGIIGSTILLTMLWRVVLRVRHGAPPPPDDLPRWLQIVSRANHYLFYGVLIAMPLLGLAALITLQEWLGDLHGALAIVLVLAILLHVAGAMFHLFKRDGVVRRMARQDPA